MKRLWMTCLSFLAPLAVFVLFASNVQLVGDAEAKKKGPPKKGAGPPTTLYCDTGSEIVPFAISAGNVDDAVAACLAVPGRPVGVS